MNNVVIYLAKKTVLWSLVCLTFFSVFLSSSAGALTQAERSNLRTPFYDPDAASCGISGIGGAANINIPLDFNLGKEPQERRSKLISVLAADFGLTPAQAAGPVGNFMWESGGEDLPPNANQGGLVGPPQFKGGYGWAQWTGGRQKSFVQFAIDNGYMSSRYESATDAANYAYLKKELSESYPETITQLKLQSTPEDAAISFEDTFENAGVPALNERTRRARTAFDEFSGPSASVSGSCGVGGVASIVGNYAFPLITKKSEIGNSYIFNNGTTDIAGHPYTAYDILIRPGTPIAAFLSGTVTRVTEDKCPGRMISIYNKESDVTISYLHMSYTNHALLGDEVEVGEKIGEVGPPSNGCGTAHLHIDAAQGNRRPGCKRENCPAENASKFLDIGPQLYETYQILPE